VDPMLTVLAAGTEQCVHVSEDTLAAPTAGPDAAPTPVSRECAELEQSVRTGEADLCASVCQDITVIPTLAASLGSVTRTRTVDLRERAKTTSVLIRVNCPVARGRSALSRTMSPSADVLEEPPEIHSETAEDSLEMKSVLLVEPTLTVRLDLMTDPSADARRPTLAIL